VCTRIDSCLLLANGVGHEFSGTGQSHYEIDIHQLATTRLPTPSHRWVARTRRKTRCSKRYDVKFGFVEDMEDSKESSFVNEDSESRGEPALLSGKSRAWPRD
jgi:hypothetical protein